MVDIEGSAIAGGACALSLAGEIAPGASARRTLLRVTAGLLITTGPALVERIDGETWRIAGGQPFRTDATGLPLLADAEAWPLEQSEPATDSPVNLGIGGPFVDALWTRSMRAAPNSQTRG